MAKGQGIDPTKITLKDYAEQFMFSVKDEETVQRIKDIVRDMVPYYKSLSDSGKDFWESMKGVESTQRSLSLAAMKQTDGVRRALEINTDISQELQEQTKRKQEQLGLYAVELPYAEKIRRLRGELAGLKQQGYSGSDQEVLEKELNSAIQELEVMQSEEEVLRRRKELHEKTLSIMGLSVDSIKTFKTTLLDIVKNPLFALLGLLTLAIAKFVNIQKSAEDFRTTTGLTVSQTKELDATVKSVYSSLKPLGVGMEEAYKSASALYDQFGNLALVNEKNVKYVADIAARLGVSEEVGASFVKSMSLAGKDATTMGLALEKMAVSSGVSVAQVMSDMAESAEDSYTFISKYPDAAARTAVQARKLGISMKEISTIASGLLDIESSLQNQMEAQILTGKAINLDAARYYALIGDQEGVMKEVVKQMGSLREFNDMNVLAQESYAKALGLSRQDIAKMLKSREEELKLTAAQRRERTAAAEQERTIQSNLTKMENAWKTIVSDLSMIFLPVIDLALPIMKGIADAVSTIHGFFADKTWLAYTLLAVGAIGIAFIKMGDAVRGIKNTWTGISESFKGTLGMFKGKGIPAPTTGANPTQMMGGDKVSQSMGKMTQFFKEVNPKNLLAGGAAMIMVAAAVWILSKAMENFAKPDMWKGVLLGIGAMTALTLSVIALGTISSTAAPMLLVGAAAMLIMGGAMWVLSDAMEKMANSAEGIMLLISTLMMADPWQLAKVGASLGLVGAGFGAMAAGAAALGVVGAIFGGGAGGGAKPQADKTEMIVEKLDTLIETVNKKSFDVYLDSKKINSVLGNAVSYR